MVKRILEPFLTSGALKAIVVGLYRNYYALKLSASCLVDIKLLLLCRTSHRIQELVQLYFECSQL